jgi:Tfp pilus assembly protein PilX
MDLAACPGGDRHQRGFALITSLLVLMLTAILAITYFTVTTGERTQSANVHVARNSLYAADAGVRTIEQALANYGKAKLDSLANYQTGTNPLISVAGRRVFFPAGAWPGSIITCTNPAFNASGTVTFVDSTLSDSAQAYDFRFTINSTGTRGAYGKRMVQSQGILRVSASRGSFADYLMFTNLHLTPSNSPIWFNSSGNFDGRMHTNGQFRFMYKPTFQDLASSVNTKAWYYNGGGTAKELAADKNGTIDVPNFFGGFTRGAPNVALPTDPYNQQNAALGLSSTSSTAPTTAQIRTQLGLTSGSGVPTDVYLPNTGPTGSPPNTLTGGIYVQGDLSQCIMKVDASGNQVYVLKQGTSSPDTIRVNRSTGVTTFYNAGTGVSKTYNGVMDQGIMFTNGAINDLRGPDRVSGVPPPALATNTKLLIATTGDIVTQRDITCKEYDTGGNVLGLYSSGGSVRVGTGAPNDMNLDAYIMATGSIGAFQVDSYDSGNTRGTFHLRGGAVTQYYGAFGTANSAGTQVSGYARDFHYDRRGLVPPYYPTSPRMNPDVPIARTLSWKEM